jgi:hypothetical protein
MDRKKLVDPKHLLVAEKMCNECLFTKNKIVSDERRAQLIAEIEKSGTYFVCHKGSLTGNNQLCCRGFYERHRTLAIALAEHLQVVKFVPVPKVEW